MVPPAAHPPRPSVSLIARGRRTPRAAVGRGSGLLGVAAVPGYAPAVSSLPPPPSSPPPPGPPNDAGWPSYPTPPSSAPAPAPGYGATPGYTGPPAYPTGYQPYGTGSLTPASFGQRLVAALIDGVVNLLIIAPFGVAAFFLLRKALENCFEDSSNKIHCPDGALQVGPLVAAIALAVIGYVLAVYCYVRWTARAQTPGQRTMNIRVLDLRSGQPIGMGRAFGRWLFRQFISGSVCFLGYLWMLWDPAKQTWHDKVTNSHVVQV